MAQTNMVSFTIPQADKDAIMQYMWISKTDSCYKERQDAIEQQTTKLFYLTTNNFKSR